MNDSIEENLGTMHIPNVPEGKSNWVIEEISDHLNRTFRAMNREDCLAEMRDDYFYIKIPGMFDLRLSAPNGWSNPPLVSFSRPLGSDGEHLVGGYVSFDNLCHRVGGVHRFQGAEDCDNLKGD